MKKIHLNKIKISDLNLNFMDEKSMGEILGARNWMGSDGIISPDRTDGCTDGFTSGCTDGCPIITNSLYNCTNSYCTDDCPTGVPQTTTDVECKTHLTCPGSGCA